jgi:protein-tyrosine phosphatase
MEKYLELEKKKQIVSKIEIPGHKASLLLSAFPGRTSANTFSVKKMLTVFSLLEKEKCSHFLSLVEDDEFSDYCDEAVLEAEAKKRLINWVHLPIADMDIPKNDTLDRLNKIRPKLFEAIKKDRSIAIHCMGGLGRSGTVAAIILADLGVPIRFALEVVRRFRPGAIETSGQENFVLNASLD